MASQIARALPAGVSFFRETEPLDDRERAVRGLRRTPIKRGKRLDPVGRLRRLTQKIYQEKRDAFMREHPICEYPECFARSEDPHHAAGRGGKNYLDTSTWLAMCRKHHNWIHAHPN